MRWSAVLILILACAMTCGCQSTEQKPAYGQESEDVPLGTMLDMQAIEAIDNGIIRQHTIFPHHFVAHTAVLNPHGRHDLDVLARHYAEYGGPLNIRRAGADAELYQARIDAVLDNLREAGVDPQRLVIADGPAGGDGLRSTTELIILERTREMGAPEMNIPLGSPMTDRRTIQ